MPVGDLVDVVRNSNRIAGRLAGGLNDEQRAQVWQVLYGMLRECSAGQSGARLRARLHVGRGGV
jgi:hypothetical protein